MNYTQATQYLNQFINFERKMPDIYKEENVNVDRGLRLLQMLGSPQKQLKAVHIAGSKGKGSVSAMSAYALQASGLQVGLYTSPHLQNVRERIRILTPDDTVGWISEADFAKLVTKIVPFADKIAGITWFEIFTALALLHFARQKVDVAIIEVGLGGRLDATNAIMPLVSVITTISMEHTDLLGDTLAEIAGEKAGIIKPQTPVIISPQKSEAERAIFDAICQQQAPATWLGRDVTYQSVGNHRLILQDHQQPNSIIDNLLLRTSLRGQHQLENASVVATILRFLSTSFPQITLASIQQGIAGTEWAGRLQVLANNPTILLDGAHNGDSARKLVEALPAYFQYEKLWFVLGMSQGKDTVGILEALGGMENAGIFLTQATHPRSLPVADLHPLAQPHFTHIQTTPNVATALAIALEHARPNDLICITGSLYIVGDLLNEWESIQSVNKT